MTILSKTKHYALAIALGCVMPLAFAPFHYWIISVIAIAGLIYLWQQKQSKKQTFLIGFYFGLGYFGLGIHWVYFSLHDFGNASPPIAGLITILLIIWQSMYIGLLGLAFRQFKMAFSHQTAYLLLPLLWFSMEWLKGIVFTGLPWLSVGYSLIDSPFYKLAPWIGSYGLSAVSVALSILLFLIISKNIKLNKQLVVVFVTTLLVLMLITQKEQTQPLQKSLKISQVQGNIAQHIKWQRSKRQEIFDIYWQQTQKHWGSDLIVWPETAVPGRSELIEESVILPMSMLATENESNILFGVIASDLANKRYFNGMLMVGVNQGIYNKRHLVPFGEYMPMRWVLDFLNQFIRIPMSDMQVGEAQQQLMSVKGIKLGVSICYEDVFSRDIALDLPEANILINTSNDAWFGDSLAPHQHLQIAQMRALEAGRPMVRSTNTGITAFIDYQGKITQKTDQFKVETITANVVGRTGQTFFIFIQPYQWMLVLLMGFIVFYSAARNRP